MGYLQDIIDRRDADIASLTDQCAGWRAELRTLRDRIPDTGTVAPDVDQRVTDVLASIRDAEVKITEQRAAREQLERELQREEVTGRLQDETHPTGARSGAQGGPDRERRPDAGDGVQSEPRTYNAGNPANGISFVSDVVSSTFLGDFAARERIQRHQAEVRVENPTTFNRSVQQQQRDVGTSAFAGLTVPQYLTDLVAPAVANARPFADNCRQLPLPDNGMTIIISRITTATSAAVQASQHAAVSETDIDDTELSIDVRTIAGQQDISLQALQRSVGTEALIISDLIRRCHTALDYSILNDDGTLGTHLGIRNVTGINAVTYTDATPTPVEAYGPLFDLAQQCETDVLMPMTHYVMHPRRWYFYSSGLSTYNTLVQSSGVPAQIMGVEQSREYGAGVRGIIAGLPVIADANIPTTISTTQDVVLGINANECILWEEPGGPMLIRAEQPNAGSLGYKLVVYQFSAFTAGRYPSAHGTISGTGLTTPTFGIAAS